MEKGGGREEEERGGGGREGRKDRGKGERERKKGEHERRGNSRKGEVVPSEGRKEYVTPPYDDDTQSITYGKIEPVGSNIFGQ